MDWKIPLFEIYWDDDDISMVTEVIKSGLYWAAGPQIQEFERLLAEYFNTEYVTTFNSGTSALHASLLAYGIGAEDEVIVPSYTFIATANAPLFVGATPVFADIEETSFGLDADGENGRQIAGRDSRVFRRGHVATVRPKTDPQSAEVLPAVLASAARGLALARGRRGSGRPIREPPEFRWA